MTLRAGVIGLGMMGRHHARVLRGLEGVTLAGVADPAGDLHHAAGSVPVVATVDHLLDLGLDYCVIATPTTTHTAIATQLAQAGIPTLIEKPLTATPDDAIQITRAFAATGTLAAVGHIERYNPAVQALRSHLAAGALGRIYQVATRRQGPYPPRIADVGVVFDLATHDIDIVIYATGMAITSVTAHTASRAGQQHEDLVAAIGLLDHTIVSSHLVNWLSPMKERVTIITGERGCLVADTLHADLTFYANGSAPTRWPAAEIFRGVTEGDMIRYAIPKQEPLVTEHEAFRDALLGDPSRIVTLTEGAATVTVAHAMLVSARGAETYTHQEPRYLISGTPSSR